MASDLVELEAPIRRAEPLTDRQSQVFSFVLQYHRLTADGCPASVVANKLKLQYNTVRGHFLALHRKGWLLTDGSPAVPRRRYLARRE